MRPRVGSRFRKENSPYHFSKLVLLLRFGDDSACPSWIQNGCFDPHKQIAIVVLKKFWADAVSLQERAFQIQDVPAVAMVFIFLKARLYLPYSLPTVYNVGLGK